MKINGNYLGVLRCSYKTAGLCDRHLEFYQTSNGIAGYLFRSTSKGWHNRQNLILNLQLKGKELITLFPQFVRMFGIEDNMWTGTIHFDDISVQYWPNLPITYLTTDGEYYFNSAGFKVFVGGQTENGYCFKDKYAWKIGKGVIYMAECVLETYEPSDEYLEPELWTKTSWINFVRDYIKSSYRNTKDFKVDDVIRDKDFIEYISEAILDMADWCDLSTKLMDCDMNGEFFYENYKEFKNQQKELKNLEELLHNKK